MRARIGILFLAAACTAACAGDKRPNGEGEAGRFRVSSALVLVNATVVDSRGRPVPGLARENFRLFENHAEKKIDWFSEDQTPVSMVIVFDTSGSMDGKLSRCAEAVAGLLRSSQTGDEFALVTFSSTTQVAQTWTRDEAAIPAALLNARAHGATAMIDALRIAGQYAATGANARKLIFVLSDGGDNSSRWTETQVRRQLQEMDLELYAVDIQESNFAPLFPAVPGGPGLCSTVCVTASPAATSR